MLYCIGTETGVLLGNSGGGGLDPRHRNHNKRVVPPIVRRTLQLTFVILWGKCAFCYNPNEDLVLRVTIVVQGCGSSQSELMMVSVRLMVVVSLSRTSTTKFSIDIVRTETTVEVVVRTADCTLEVCYTGCGERTD